MANKEMHLNTTKSHSVKKFQNHRSLGNRNKFLSTNDHGIITIFGDDEFRDVTEMSIKLRRHVGGIHSVIKE